MIRVTRELRTSNSEEMASAWLSAYCLGGAQCTVPTLCEKQVILDPFSPLAKVTAATIVFPDLGLPQIPIQFKNSDNE